MCACLLYAKTKDSGILFTLIVTCLQLRNKCIFLVKSAAIFSLRKYSNITF